jgi:hypothetical protein
VAGRVDLFGDVKQGIEGRAAGRYGRSPLWMTVVVRSFGEFVKLILK